MDKENSQKGRRVSFAPEHQINYIYADDNTSSKTISSLHETPMDLTTEIAEFKNLKLFERLEDTLPKQDIDSIFSNDVIFEYKEDPFLLREYEKRKRSLNRKNSLDPLLGEQFDLTIAEDPLHTEENAENGVVNSLNPSEDFENASIQNNSENIENIELNNNNTNIQNESIFFKKPIVKKKSIEGSFNDTSINDSSFAVEELVTTVDLRKIINQEKKEKKEINEFLALMGIRFLDESITEGIRRDTLSKSRNIVDPELILYYKYSVKERIEYLYNFSGFIAEKMNELQLRIDDVQKNIDSETLNKDLLKKIRNESRNRAKIDWYSLRKINELQFNKKIMENKNKLIETYVINQKEVDRLKNIIDIKNSNISNLKEKIAEIERLLDKSDPTKMIEAEKLQQMISDRKTVLDSAKVEFDAITRSHNELRIEEEMVERRIMKLRAENEVLRKNLINKSTTEAQLNTIKTEVNRYKLLYGIKVLKLKKDVVVFDINSVLVSLNLNSSLEVTGVSVDIKDNDHFFEMSKLDIPFSIPKLSEYLRVLVSRILFAASIKREVLNLKDKIKTECFFVNQNLYLRFFSNIDKRFIDLMVNTKFDLIYQNIVVCNLLSNLCGITKLVEKEINW